MNTHKGKLVVRIGIVLFILIVAIYLFRMFIIGKPITSFYSNNPEKITKIDVMSGNTGEVKSITSQEDIKTITDYLATVTLKRRYPPASTGWNYSITAYSDEKELIKITDMGSIYVVNNDGRYEVSSSKDTHLYDILEKYMK